VSTDWLSEADEISAAISSSTCAHMERRVLNDRLLEYRFTCSRPGSTDIALLVSPTEVILEAGRGTRFELDALPKSSAEIQRVARAIASGGLTEVVDRRSVKFELSFSDGSKIAGHSSGVRTGVNKQQTIRYQAFGENL
jgi:hypothetical protein